MDNELREQEQLNKITKKQIALCLIFLLCLVMIGVEVSYEMKYEKRQENDFLSAQKKKQEIDRQIQTFQGNLLSLKTDYVQQISAKTCVVLCFDQFGKSAYSEIIDAMDRYGYTGVIIFRDGQVPGKKGSISVELYQQLLEKGWEGAIGNTEEMLIYNHFPEVKKKKWLAYMQEMQSAFEKNGLPIPTVYIPNKYDSADELEEMLLPLGMKAYTTVGIDLAEVYDVATHMNTDALLNMGTIIGRYEYDSLEEDLRLLTPEAKSLAIWYRKIEVSAPGNLQYTSSYMFQKQLEILSALNEQVNVTTFSGYQAYQKALVESNPELYEYYKTSEAELLEKIAKAEKEREKTLHGQWD